MADCLHPEQRRRIGRGHLADFLVGEAFALHEEKVFPEGLDRRR
jgi:hypothetical protein